MSQESVRVVRRILRSVNDQDIDSALLDLDPDAELDWSGSEAPDSGVFRGHAGWREWMAGRREGLSGVRFDITEVIDTHADRLVTVVHVQSRGRASGIEIASVGAGVWTLRGGKVTRLTLYQSRADALKAVGLKQ